MEPRTSRRFGWPSFHAVPLLAALAPMLVGAGSPPTDDDKVSIDLGYELFLANYEYFDIPYRQGETVFGDLVEGRIGYHDSAHLAFYVGGLARRPYDGGGVDKGYPLATVAYRPDSEALWLFGSLPRHHDFAPQIYESLQDFLQPHLDGVQYSSNNLMTFVNWDLYDTEDHGEKFSANILWHHQLDRFNLLSQARWTHQGGQLHDHPDTGIVHDRVAMAGVHVRLFEAEGFHGAFKPEAFGNRFSRSTDPANDKRGWGTSSRLEFGTPGPGLAYEFWRSRDFFTADGDPLYQTEKMHSLLLFKGIALADDRLKIQMEGRGRWFEGKFAHSQLLRVHFILDRVVHP